MDHRVRIVGSFRVISKVSFGFVNIVISILVLCLLACPLLVRMEIKYASNF